MRGGGNSVDRDGLLEMLRAAAAKHSAMAGATMMGCGFEQHFFALFKLARDRGDAIELFDGDEGFRALFVENVVKTTHLESPVVEGCVVAPGNSPYDPLVEHPYVLAYNNNSNHIRVVTTCYKGGEEGAEGGRAAVFNSALREALGLVKQLVGGRNAPAVAATPTKEVAATPTTPPGGSPTRRQNRKRLMEHFLRSKEVQMKISSFK